MAEKNTKHCTFFMTLRALTFRTVSLSRIPLCPINTHEEYESSALGIRFAACRVIGKRACTVCVRVQGRGGGVGVRWAEGAEEGGVEEAKMGGGGVCGVPRNWNLLV